MVQAHGRSRHTPAARSRLAALATRTRPRRFCLPILILAAPSSAFAGDVFHFENDILLILGGHGCNSSGCHGKAEGQGGFKLSVFASDPEADYAALTKEGRGRRTLATALDESLLLRKASGRTKLHSRGEDYRTLRDWIAAGMRSGLRTPRRSSRGGSNRPSASWGRSPSSN